MRHTGLFNGIGGFMLAAEWMGWENVDSVEIDPWCNKIIEKNFPNVNRYYDIKEYKGQSGSVDILTGGFPCQPFSHAGKRKGKSDDRYLWPEYLRVIREIKPTYVVGENVAGLISMEDGKTLEGVFSDLEGEGYIIESFIIPACSVGAWHRRDRIWIIANNHSRGRGEREDGKIHRGRLSDSFRDSHCKNAGKILPNPDISRCQERGEQQESPRQFTQICRWSSEPNVGRVANGIPRRVDRLKGLGNAIVPAVALEIFKAIEKTFDATAR